jgi:hypothetical protein
MEEIDYNTTLEFSNFSPEELLNLSRSQKSLLYILLRNLQNKRLQNTFLIQKHEFVGLTYVLLLLIKYCNDWKNIIVVCKTTRQLNSLFEDCQKILTDRFVKIVENKIYFLDDYPVFEYDFDKRCIKSNHGTDIVHCITFCQKPNFTFKALFIWTEGTYTEMKYYNSIFALKSIWLLSPTDRISPDLYERNDIIKI